MNDSQCADAGDWLHNVSISGFLSSNLEKIKYFEGHKTCQMNNLQCGHARVWLRKVWISEFSRLNLRKIEHSEGRK